MRERSARTSSRGIGRRRSRPRRRRRFECCSTFGHRGVARYDAQAPPLPRSCCSFRPTRPADHRPRHGPRHDGPPPRLPYASTFDALRHRKAITRCGAVSLLVRASPGGAVFYCEFLIGDVEVRHRRFEILVLELLGWDTSVLFDLLGLALRHLVSPEPTIPPASIIRRLIRLRRRRITLRGLKPMSAPPARRHMQPVCPRDAAPPSQP